MPLPTEPCHVPLKLPVQNVRTFCLELYHFILWHFGDMTYSGFKGKVELTLSCTHVRHTGSSLGETVGLQSSANDSQSACAILQGAAWGNGCFPFPQTYCVTGQLSETFYVICSRSSEKQWWAGWPLPFVAWWWLGMGKGGEHSSWLPVVPTVFQLMWNSMTPKATGLALHLRTMSRDTKVTLTNLNRLFVFQQSHCKCCLLPVICTQTVTPTSVCRHLTYFFYCCSESRPSTRRCTGQFIGRAWDKATAGHDWLVPSYPGLRSSTLLSSIKCYMCNVRGNAICAW